MKVYVGEINGGDHLTDVEKAEYILRGDCVHCLLPRDAHNMEEDTGIFDNYVPTPNCPGSVYTIDKLVEPATFTKVLRVRWRVNSKMVSTGFSIDSLSPDPMEATDLVIEGLKSCGQPVYISNQLVGDIHNEIKRLLRTRDS